MGLVLDTSVLIAAEREDLDWPKLGSHLSTDSPFISAITLSELWHGCHRGKGVHLQRRIDFVRGIESLLPVLAFDRKEALVHAKIWAEMESSGQKVGDRDLIIAATALANSYSVATLNDKEFVRIPSLRLTSLKQFVLG